MTSEKIAEVQDEVNKYPSLRKATDALSRQYKWITNTTDLKNTLPMLTYYLGVSVDKLNHLIYNGFVLEVKPKGTDTFQLWVSKDIISNRKG